jgi:hypothetical protein
MRICASASRYSTRTSTRLLRAFERVGDHHRDVLAVVVDQPVLQQRNGDERSAGLALAGWLLRQSRRVLGRQDRQDAGYGLGRCEIEAGDLAAGDRALYEHCMR